MSLWPILWAINSAPVADAEERLILVALADRASSDGTDAYPSKKSIAKVALIDPKTVQRRLRSMMQRGLIAEGNQAAALRIPEHFRPTVYDLLIPYSWWSMADMERVNAERIGRGLSPLTPASRPDLGQAPPRKQRADKGKRRKKPAADPGTTSPRGEDSEPLGEARQGGGTTSPGGGDYKSSTGGLQDPQTSPTNLPGEPPRPSVPVESGSVGDGGTDGARVPSQISRNPGVDLLVAIGAEKPEFLLTGKTLQDQGMAVAGMLLEGWTPDQLRQVISGRPLPDQIATTVGAIVSGRIRQALSGPVPESVGNGTYMASAMSVGVATLPRQTVVPLQNCDRCDRAFRSPERGLCPNCRKDATA
jgi:hypothetical protein